MKKIVASQHAAALLFAKLTFESEAGGKCDAESDWVVCSMLRTRLRECTDEYFDQTACNHPNFATPAIPSEWNESRRPLP